MMLDVQDLTRRFGRETALDGVSFSAEAGERIAVVGRNGAGKTTLLRVLSTFLPADSGRASVAGFDLFSQGGAVRSVVGYLPEGAPLDPDLRVAEYLRFRGRLRRMSGRHLRRRLHDVAAFCGLAPVLSTRIRALSAGQRHAVGLADAILHEPDILLFDDPLAAADAVQARAFAKLLALAGAKRENIFDCGLDTITDSRFRSYRREGKREPMLSAVTPGEKLPYAACG